MPENCGGEGTAKCKIESNGKITGEVTYKLGECTVDDENKSSGKFCPSIQKQLKLTRTISE